MADFDLLVIGAGINGGGIARDASARGLSVLVCDKGDIGGATSSASTKLIHGGLRYLERYAFRLVAESLAERETVLRIAPHLVREQRFVIPHTPQLRPAWMLRLGLALYDRMGGRSSLERSRTVSLEGTLLGEPLRPGLRKGFAYSDLSVDDARLTLANILAASDSGARVLVRTRLLDARRVDGGWEATLADATGATSVVRARIIVNAAGPWVAKVRSKILGRADPQSVRLVKGSHVVLPRLYAGEHAYLFQNPDRRIVFAVPFDDEWTMLGTTESLVPDPDQPIAPTRDEIDYLCRSAAAYFRRPIDPGDTRWAFSGMRALYDDGQRDPNAISREYRLVTDAGDREAPLLSVFGGKLTTYRALAEKAVDRLREWVPEIPASRTANDVLPGGALPSGGMPALLSGLADRYPDLPRDWLRDVARRHGARAAELVGDARIQTDLGTDFGGRLYAREVDHFRRREWAIEADDVLYRRTRCGVRMTSIERDRFARQFAAMSESGANAPRSG